jgi:N-acyl-phosphatidylethanolamine-hydrolysing phospholipase D
MAWEAVDEPPKLLKAAREALGVTEEQFGVPVLGETRAFEA